MNKRNTGRGVEEAWRMLELFGSVGAQRFDLTRTDLEGQKCGYGAGASLAALRGWMPELLEIAGQRQQNVIVRPKSGWAELVQLDDLRGAGLERVREAAFLVLCTSRGNHQAWVAVRGGGEDFARRLRRGSGADPCASGATRIAGSVNFKRAYAPDYPTVQLVKGKPEHVVTAEELETVGLVAPVAPAMVRTRASGPARAWPSYERCLQNAPPAHALDRRPDVSRADFTFCLLAMDWGWSLEQTRQRLLEQSRKAQHQGEPYAQRTVARAAEALLRRSGNLQTRLSPEPDRAQSSDPRFISIASR